tara:strand:+ start:448 stop:906 length:459 start_codon:yes stop_codon:yes gene_type:complete
MNQHYSLADIKQVTRALMEQLGLIEQGEELEALKYSLNELVCFNAKGHFAPCVKGNAYSLSKKGADKLGVSHSYVGKGELTRDAPVEKEKGKNPYKMVSKFGQAKQSGRIALPDGDDIPIKKRVVGFPTPYSESPPKGKDGKSSSSPQKKKK